MATRVYAGRSALITGRSGRWGGKWSLLSILGLTGLAAWLCGALASAQQGAPLNLPPPVPDRLSPVPVKVESTLPKWKSDQPELKPPPEILKPPKEVLEPPTEVLRAPAELPSPPADLARAQADMPKPPADPTKAVCPPGTVGKNGEQCDPNLPVVACPSPKDDEERNKYVGQIIDPKNPLTMYLGRTRLLMLKETPKRIQIGDEKIVDYTLINPKQISLLAKSLGDTVLNLWFTEEKVVSYLVKVIPDPDLRATLDARYTKLAADINRMFPNSRVCLTLVGDKLVVQGQALDVAEATQILRIARAAAPKIDDPKLPYNLQVNLDPAGANRDRVRDLLEAAGPYVINLMRIPGEQQVTLKVTVAEINRSAARSIGLNFAYNNGNFAIANTTGNIAGTTTGLGLGAIQGAGLVGTQAINTFNQAANNIPVTADRGRLTLAIDALRNLNYARTLAEPSLLTLDGQTATLQAGGQFPTPQVTGGANTFVGLQSVEFVPYGVQLSFTPYITDRDRVRLSLSASVSTRDLSATANINGTLVPGLNQRSFQTVVELRHGQTFAVAGLIQNNLGAQASRIPLLGDLPIIGRVLGFDQLSAGEQELVVLVTPVFSHPLNNDEISPLPGSDLFEPGDLEFYLLGRLESRREYDYRSPVRTDIHRMMRYHRCEQLYIIGPHGHSDAVAGQPTNAK